MPRVEYINTIKEENDSSENSDEVQVVEKVPQLSDQPLGSSKFDTIIEKDYQPDVS